MAILQGGDFVISSDDGTTPVFDVAGADGDTAWASGATLTLEGLSYAPPTGASVGHILQVAAVSGADVTLQWGQLIHVGNDPPTDGSIWPIWLKPDGDEQEGHWTKDGTNLYPTVEGTAVQVRDDSEVVKCTIQQGRGDHGL